MGFEAAPDTAQRISVLTLIDHLGEDGGAENLALSIAINLDPDRYESILCASRWPIPGEPDATSARVLERLREAGVRLVGLRRSGKLDVWVWYKLFRFLRRERIQVLHAHKFGSNLWGTVLGRAASVPVVIAQEHTWSYEGHLLRRLLDRYVIARGADRFVAVSREDQRRMISIERISEQRIVFVPNGLAPDRVQPSGHSSIRAELGIEPDAPVIGMIGRLRPQKAHHVLVRASALLSKDYPNMQVLIVGEGPEYDALQRLIGDVDVGKTVRLLGMRTDVADVLLALDIAVLCSDFEGTPIAVLEYMAAGLPVVATAVGGVPDLVEHGRNGLLVPPGDPEALARALSELLQDRGRARAMGDEGRRRQHSEFDMETMIRRFDDLYVELLTCKGRLPRAT